MSFVDLKRLIASSYMKNTERILKVIMKMSIKTIHFIKLSMI